MLFHIQASWQIARKGPYAQKRAGYWRQGFGLLPGIAWPARFSCTFRQGREAPVCKPSRKAARPVEGNRRGFSERGVLSLLSGPRGAATDDRLTPCKRVMMQQEKGRRYS